VLTGKWHARTIMSLEFFFNVLTKVWLVGEILILVFTTTRRSAGKVQDRGTQIILWIVIIASFWIDGWMHRFFPADMPGSSTWLLPAAIAILILGLVVRAVAFFSLGKAFSANVAMRAGQKLNRNGLYHFVRHPSYLGLELILFACALHARAWACFAVILIPPTLAVLYRIHVEETALHLAFGADYEDYCRNTKRLVPGIY
jgi:protein-S-isoprenylcysteine O-methyltransferase Ste14